jgi:predicted metal-dependent peptidase
MSRKKTAQQLTPADANFARGLEIVRHHPLFAPLAYRARVQRTPGNRCPGDGWAVVSSAGMIYAHPTRLGTAEEWAYVLAHCLLHLGFGHFDARANSKEWNDACDWFLLGFLRRIQIGRAPPDMVIGSDPPAPSEERIWEIFRLQGFSVDWQGCGAAGLHTNDMAHEPSRRNQTSPRRIATGTYSEPSWQELFAEGLSQAVAQAVVVASGEYTAGHSVTTPKSPAQRARAWFLNHYPLLGALAASFTIVEDAGICQREGISIAAVDPESREIYFSPALDASRRGPHYNPAFRFSDEEYRFVMAHELLHVGLRHDVRRRGRDPYLWNVSCDYVINSWLVDMKVGTMPIGALYDAQLAGDSAESIFDRIVTDLRRFRRLATMRGVGVSDILERGQPQWWERGAGIDLDAYYRGALAQGLTYHQSGGRGYLPLGLIEEIHALAQPPIPWDVELARWFDHYFPPLERVRSYARPSRRQSATPDIPRPRMVPPPDWAEGRTFGIVLDTSGSMDRRLLAKGLGAIASYSLSRDVPAARVVFCDAVAYDQGYMRPEAIAEEDRVRGRGGTVLQPAIDLLQGAPDFPANGPILIITDGKCDRLMIQHEHAFLMPEGATLPFVPKGPVFRLS